MNKKQTREYYKKYNIKRREKLRKIRDEVKRKVEAGEKINI